MKVAPVEGFVSTSGMLEIDYPLADNDVHVWWASLSAMATAVAHIEPLLTKSELARAERFYFPRDRRHFIVGRGLLRMLLSRYAGLPPAQLELICNAYGKPDLAGANRLRFNLSHSGDIVLYGITRCGDIGVDVEQIRTNLEWEQLAERFFSSQEAATLRMLPAEVRLASFFRCWTRKEAYVKARGQGLSLPLASFDVSLAPDEKAQLLASRESLNETTRWTFQGLTPAAGYVAAVVVEGSSQRIQYGRLRLQLSIR